MSESEHRHILIDITCLSQQSPEEALVKIEPLEDHFPITLQLLATKEQETHFFKN